MFRLQLERHSDAVTRHTRAKRVVDSVVTRGYDHRSRSDLHDFEPLEKRARDPERRFLLPRQPIDDEVEWSVGAGEARVSDGQLVTSSRHAFAEQPVAEEARPGAEQHGCHRDPAGTLERPTTSYATRALVT